MWQALLKEIFESLRWIALWFGVFILVIIFGLLVDFRILKLPDFADNFLDALFYYAYNYEENGVLAILFRWLIIVLVVWKLYDLGLIAYQYIIKKINQT